MTILTGNNTSYTLAASVTDTVNGSGDTINEVNYDTVTLNNTGEVVNMKGVGSTVVDNSSSNTINVNSTSETVSASSDTINVAAKDQASITESNDGITLAAGSSVGISSAASLYDYVNGSNAFITTIGITNIDLLAGTGDTISVTGTNNTLWATNGTATGNTYNFNGPASNNGSTTNVVDANQSTINVGANQGLYSEFGTGNTINLNGGSRSYWDDTTSYGNTIKDIVSGNSITAYNDSISLATGVSATLGGYADTITFGSGVADNQLWFSQSGNDLLISVIGTTATDTIQGWYSNPNSASDVFKTSTGNTLSGANVANLVNAMASFSVPPLGQTTIPTADASTLLPVIAANWH